MLLIEMARQHSCCAWPAVQKKAACRM